MKGGVSILERCQKALVVSLAALALFPISCASRRQKAPPPVIDPSEPRKSWSSAEGVEHLLVARRFAFGPDINGGISDGEYAFRAVLKSPEAPTMFKTAYGQATTEGQLYALCGVRAAGRDSFEDYASPLRNETRLVMAQSGGITTNEPIADVVQRIAAGDYDRYFTNWIVTPPAPHPATQ